MLEESLHRRLEALNRQRFTPAASKPSEASATKSRTGKTPASTKRQGSAQVAAKKPAGFFERGKVVSTHRGEHLAFTIPVAEFWPQADTLLRGRHEQLATQSETADGAAIDFLAAFPSRFLALDLETCGLSGSALFLVGLAREVAGEFVVELLFARNYAEEAAVLCSLGERLSNAETLVTFNGKSFDWPMVGDRWRRHLLDRKQPLPDLPHYDVLHPARRKWRGTLPDCKLQTIERLVCRRSRTGDIAGHLIPGAYDHYVRTSDTREMEGVLYHNTVDLVTLLDVAMRVAG